MCERALRDFAGWPADGVFSEWLTHQHRDTLASIVGHPPLLAYVSLADGECQARERFELIEVSTSSSEEEGADEMADQRMLQPCGKPPGKTDD